MQEVLEKYKTVSESNVSEWFKVGKTTDFPEDSGACVKHNTKQIAVYNFTRTGKWYATQNVRIKWKWFYL